MVRMKTYTSWIVTIVAVLLIIGAMVWYAGRPGKYDTFASCIADSGTKFYGAFWCPHCQSQKALFGKSAKNLPYVECSTPNGQGQTQACIDADVESYPTWEFGDGSRKTGEATLAELAVLTQCPLVVDSTE